MGQKTHPFGFRVGITEAHRSRWYAPKLLYGELLVEDQAIRKYCYQELNKKPPYAAVADVPYPAIAAGTRNAPGTATRAGIA